MPCAEIAEHAKAAVRGDAAAVVGTPGTMAREGENHVFRRRRVNHRRSRHLHEDEVAEAWGENSDRFRSRSTFTHCSFPVLFVCR